MISFSGNNLLATVTEEDDDLNIDMVWEIIDWFKNAIVLTREKEVFYALTIIVLLIVISGGDQYVSHGMYRF